jgi:hypothetical protein
VGTQVVIEPRFNGPPDSGNGGYACGLVARAVDGVAEVSLRRPPPLAVPLEVEGGGDRARLLDGDGEVVAEGEAVGPERLVEPPAAVSREEAREAVDRSTYLDASTHPFPTCFVCGPLREQGDGLRIFPGRLESSERVFACTWTPPGGDGDGGSDRGPVPEELVWAALDCPTSAPGMNEPGPDGVVLPIVLARLAVDVRGPVQAGAEHVITSWEIARDGRKREAGAALYAADGGNGEGGGEPLALARALWIELRSAPSAGG